jgi:hypothetical protein
MVDTVQPDLVIFTGDIVDGRPFADNSWRATFVPIIQPLLDAKPPVPWTYCPGNHDDDHAPWGRSDLLVCYSIRLLARTLLHTNHSPLC